MKKLVCYGLPLAVLFAVGSLSGQEPNPAPATSESAAAETEPTLAERVDRLEALLKKVAVIQGTVPADPVPAIGVMNDQKDVMTAPKVGVAPAVDGKLDDPAWKQAVQVSLVSPEKTPLMNNTAILVCHDENNLYIGAVCMEMEMDKLHITCTERDQKVYRDDCIEFYLDTNMNRQDAVKLVVNPNGVFMDFLRGERRDIGDVNWDCTIRTTRESDRYIMEIAIPLKDMGVEYKPGVKIGFNAYRMRQGNGKRFEGSTWHGQANRIATIGTLALE